MFERRESEYFRAKMKAARNVYRGRVKPVDLPSNSEIQLEIQNLSRLFDGRADTEHKLREMRILGLQLMVWLKDYRPRLIGSVLSGRIRRGSDIDIQLFAPSIDAVAGTLDYHGLSYQIERKTVRKAGEVKTYRHLHVRDRFPIELTVYPIRETNFVSKCSITGKPIERVSLNEFRQFLLHEYPGIDLEHELKTSSNQQDRFHVFYHLLLPLEKVQQNPSYHPEGDALYHSLQVFDLACDCLPYDEEFLTAALLHDVGKGISPTDHVNAGLDALEGLITPRTAWLIRHHMEAHRINDHTIGVRAKKRLQSNDSYQELVLLGECDRGGRCQGVSTSSLEEAIDYLRDLDSEFL